MATEPSSSSAPATVSAAPSPRATFFGTAYHKVSPHNQVSLPSPMKRVLDANQEGQLLLVRLPNLNYLQLFTQARFDEVMAKLKTRKALAGAKRIDLVRSIAKSACPIDLDSQGRFVLPAHWVEALGLKEEVAFCGASQCIEIWPAAAQRELEAKPEPEAAESATAVAEAMYL